MQGNAWRKLNSIVDDCTRLPCRMYGTHVLTTLRRRRLCARTRKQRFAKPLHIVPTVGIGQLGASEPVTPVRRSLEAAWQARAPPAEALSTAEMFQTLRPIRYRVVTQARQITITGYMALEYGFLRPVVTVNFEVGGRISSIIRDLASVPGDMDETPLNHLITQRISNFTLSPLQFQPI